MCIKSDFEEIILKLATNGQSDKGFLLTSRFVSKGLSAPALGLYTCIKALKYIPGPGVRWAFTGPLVLWLGIILLTSCGKNYRENPTHVDKIFCNSVIWTRWLYNWAMHPKDSGGKANSAGPDRTASLGAIWSESALFTQTCLFKNLLSMRYFGYDPKYFDRQAWANIVGNLKRGSSWNMVYPQSWLWHTQFSSVHERYWKMQHPRLLLFRVYTIC